MLFFIICACFAIFPQQVLCGAQIGLALCINTVIPSLLPFMLLSSCLIKSNFSRPLGYITSKILTPVTGISPCGCICFITGLLGGYGAGAGAVVECFKEGQIDKKEAEHLLAFCNNAGPLFVIGTVGISFFLSRSMGVLLFLIQLITAVICASLFSVKGRDAKTTFKQEWDYYKKNKPSLGRVAAQSATSSGIAIISVCVFVITFSAILEVLPIEKMPFIAAIIEVTRGCSELSRAGNIAIPIVSAALSWGGLSVHFQADSLCHGELKLKTYYLGRICAAIISFLIAYITKNDINILLIVITLTIAFLIIKTAFTSLFASKDFPQPVFRQQRHS